jgi:hypothetical protein
MILNAKNFRATSARSGQSVLSAPSVGSSAAAGDAAASTTLHHFELPSDFETDFLRALDEECGSLMSWSDISDSVLTDVTASWIPHNRFFENGTRVECVYPHVLTKVPTLFFGEVENFCGETGWYYVRFEDGDTAEFDHDELVGMLRHD